MRRYGLGQDALVQLARDLDSSEASSRRRALRALRSDFRVRALVNLVASVLDAADERIAAGTYPDDASQLEQFRPIAEILPRLHQLRLDPNHRIASAAAVALTRLHAPPPSYVRERLVEWLRLPSLALAIALPAALGAVLSVLLGVPFWITFAATAFFAIVLVEAVVYWSMRKGKAAADALMKEWRAASPHGLA